MKLGYVLGAVNLAMSAANLFVGDFLEATVLGSTGLFVIGAEAAASDRKNKALDHKERS